MKPTEHHKQAISTSPAALEEQLRADRPRLAPSADFTARVLNNLPTRPDPLRDERTPGLGALLPRIAFALAAAGICAALFLSFNARKSAPQNLIAKTALPADAAIQDKNTALSFPTITTAEIEALSAKLNQPLDREMKNVVSDTRQAIQFVAANFLPEN
jgi:hypothetical protein